MASKINRSQLEELLYQALETEIGGEELYSTAIKCALNDDLKEEWEEYLEQTRNHHDLLVEVFDTFGLSTETMTPGRKVVGHIGESLVKAIKLAKKEGSAEAAQLVAAECVVLAETKDHTNWELLERVAEELSGEEGEVLAEACEIAGEQESHHLFHTRGFLRELWIDSLGMPAVLPPPEEKKSVETAIGASRAEHQRENML